MELKALILGILFSTGIFALKSGAGLYYAATRQRGVLRKIMLICAFIAGYIVLFRLSFLTLARFDIVHHLNLINYFLRAGMLVHFAMAMLMAFWGLRLLKGVDMGYSLGWLTLSVPCPVCMIVIFSTSAFLMSIFPDASDTAFWLASGSFVSLILVTFLVMHLAQKGLNFSPNLLLGWAMLIISGYFVLSAMIIPQISDIERVYRLSMQNAGAVQPGHGLAVLVLFFSTIALGFLWTLFKIRRAKAWI